MEKVVIFGAGGTGGQIFEMVKDKFEVVFFVDNDSEKWGKMYKGKTIKAPHILKEGGFDRIVMGTIAGFQEIRKQLESMELAYKLLDITNLEVSFQARVLFMIRFAEISKSEELLGSVAEVGVYKGEFAKEINKYFNDRKCYLFDTFKGFDERDLENEELTWSSEGAGHFSDTSVEAVLEKMPNRELVIIKEGYFPETAIGLEDIFCFVNLDLDLYLPTLEGLRYFWPRMSSGGVILIHEYFSEVYPNVSKAVKDFELETKDYIRKMPIGDDLSIALIK